LLLLVSSFAAAAYFVIFPLWQIEHPTDATLVLRGERHLLWQAPVHAHLDAAAIAIPILAIAIVATALIVMVLHSGE
jgi:hypothetical protein